MLQAALLSLALAAVLRPLAVPDAIPFDATHWTMHDPNAATLQYLGRPSLFLDNGMALANGVSFADGTIEFDVAMYGHASFAGVAFRAQSADDCELVYLRPHRSRQPDALQYTPLFGGSEAWQLYSGQGYTAAAELPLDRWVHVRLAVNGYRADLYVDNAAEPQLTIVDLKRPWAHGQIGLWGRLGGAVFSNVVVTPASSSTAPAAPAIAPAAEGVITNWTLSPAWDTDTVRPDRLPEARGGWGAASAESSGVVNIARFRHPVQRTVAPSAASRDVVFARTVISEAGPSREKLVIGYSDAVHVFLNGKLLFEGESGYRSRDPAFLGIVSLGPDAIYLDLAAGDNELVLAVSESFGGWGFAARVEHVSAGAGGG